MKFDCISICSNARIRAAITSHRTQLKNPSSPNRAVRRQGLLSLLAIRSQHERQPVQGIVLFFEDSVKIAVAGAGRRANTVLFFRYVHLRRDSCCFFRASCFSTCPVRTLLEEKLTAFFIRSKIAFSPSGLMAVTSVRSMTSFRPPKSWLVFLQVVPSSATQTPMRVPSTRSVRRDGVSAMDILSMLRLYPTRARTGPGYRKTFAKATWLTPWQPVESVRAGQTGDGVCRRLSRSIVNCREWGQIKRRKLLSRSCAGAAQM